ncbi:hypothetical protein F9L07_19865 [Pimelobacter simplex]|uniref:Uncharacterized protein n=1 Tax=Nocardioides simplex TaxID=2045 RepID=A0A7J5DVQ0_NOCSI|nr:hypothetical protein [Pimelobacter simplex]KAB2809299.1 hypothetical protein F9L07_19865 [Pimelobacter simplex]
MSTRSGAFVNERRTVVTDFGPNPTNPAAGLARDAFLRLWGFLVPVVGGGSLDPSGQFHGVAAPIQDFVGAANPASNTVVTRDGAYPNISSGVTAEGDAVRRMFAERLARRSAL